MNQASTSGLRTAAVWLAVTGLIVLIFARYIGTDNQCSVRVMGECVSDDASLFVFIFGMGVLTWAAIFLAAHKIVIALRG